MPSGQGTWPEWAMAWVVQTTFPPGCGAAAYSGHSVSEASRTPDPEGRIVVARSWIRTGPRGDTGAAAVEFALVSLVLLTLVIGIIQASIFFWAYQAGAHAAREGARFYAVDPCNGDGQDNDTAIRRRVGPASAGGADTVAVSATFSAGSPPQTGDDVTVRVSFPVPDVAGGFVRFLSTVTKEATARVEDVEDC